MKKQEGITLVALVITIIVLLILAGVSISLVVGNNGVLTQASNSVVTSKAADAKQSLQMAQAAVETYHYAQWANNTSITRKDEQVNSEDVKGTYSDSVNGLAAQLANEGYKIGSFSGGTFTVQTDDGVVQEMLERNSEVALQSNSGDIFVFTNVKIDQNTGKLTYEDDKTLTVYSASGKEQGSIDL